MTTIPNLTHASTLSGSDLVVMFSTFNSATVGSTLNQLAEYFARNITFKSDKITQFYDNVATGFVAQINNDVYNVWAIITPNATIATGTLILPSNAIALDKQEVEITSSQDVTALTIDPAGAAIVGVPTGLIAGTTIAYRFNKLNNTWYKVR